MLMLNDIAGALNKIANSKRDRTMLMLNAVKSIIEILPADFSSLPILLNA